MSHLVHAQATYTALSAVLFIHCNGQVSSQDDDNTVHKHNHEANLWFNVVLLFLLVLLFVYSIRFNHKCRRRRRKLPHEIRLERTNKQINAQLKDLTFKTEQYEEYKEYNDYLTDDITDDESKNDIEYDMEAITDSMFDMNDIIHDEPNNNDGLIEHGKLLINNINHYVHIQYDQYKDTHTQIVQDMLGMNGFNDSNSDYEPL